MLSTRAKRFWQKHVSHGSLETFIRQCMTMLDIHKWKKPGAIPSFVLIYINILVRINHPTVMGYTIKRWFLILVLIFLLQRWYWIPSLYYHNFATACYVTNFPYMERNFTGVVALDISKK